MIALVPTVGTVSHGTLRNEDLLAAFADALERYGESDSNTTTLLHEAREMAKELANIELDDYQFANQHQAEADELLTELFDALDEIAVKHGMYFGATEGDGSDFGFWPIPEENQP